MRVANLLTDVLEPACAELSIDPKSVDFTLDLARRLIAYTNQHTRTAWEMDDWPELDVTEERAFRSIWNTTKTFKRVGANGLPDELFYIPGLLYYKVKADAPADPPAGTLPTDTDYFEPLDLLRGDRYIDLDQDCRRAIGEVRGTYSGDPRRNGCRKGLPFRLSEKGIDINGTAGFSAFIRYQIRPSKFTSELFDPDKVYKKHELCYWSPDQDGDGNCYRRLSAGDTTTPATPSVWALVPMPERFAQYVSYMVASSAAEDASSQARLEARALDCMSRQMDKLIEQGARPGSYRIGFRRRGSCFPMHGWCSSVAWSESSTVTTLTDACQDEGGAPVPELLQALGFNYDPTIDSLRDGAKPLAELDVSQLATLSLITIWIPNIDGIPQRMDFRLEEGAADPDDPAGSVETPDPDRHWQKG